MSDLPQGTVTFLFTDVERSTQTVGEVGDDRYADLQDTHRKLLREAFSAHDGVEVSTEGDALFVAFARATDAVAAAIDGQRALTAGSELRVRMGLHTGEAVVRGTDYVGHAVHAAKRISDAGHGGQILVSQTTADLIRPRFTLLDLGPHRLKDLGDPQRLLQVTADDLPNEFPPLRSLESFRHNLPAQRSSFVGREKELASLQDAVRTERLVTLTGIGGSGKTRLALQAAAELLAEHADGVYFCDLSPVSNPDLVAATIAGAAGVASGGGAFAGPAGPIDEMLIDHLAHRDCLLVVDNCEHLLDASAEIIDRILANCPGVKVLTTSREALAIEGERSIRIPSLSLPDNVDDIAESEAVTLFLARAKEVVRDFELTRENVKPIVAICRRLDGIPLAIEFAASRISHLSPHELDERLQESFRLLVGGRRRVQRQATIQATLDWSFDLLSESEKTLLTRLSVFSGTLDLRSAESVCAGEPVQRSDVVDLMGSLVARSMVVVDALKGVTRYRLLETVRLYAAEKLRDGGESERYHDRHRDHFLAWLESIPWEDTLFDEIALDEMLTERANIVAAFEWSAVQDRADLIVRMAARLHVFWIDGEYLYEGYRWTTHVRPEDVDVDVEVRMGCLLSSAMIAIMLQDPDMRSFDRRALEVWDGRPHVLACYALTRRSLAQAVVAAFTRDPDVVAKTRAYIQQAKDVAEHIPLAVRWLPFWAEGFAETTMGNYPAAIAAAERALPMIDRRRQPSQYTWNAALLGALSHVDGDDARASRLGDEIAGDLRGHVSLIGPVVITAVSFAKTGRSEEAKKMLIQSVGEARRSGIPGALGELMIGVAAIAAIAGDSARASRLLWWVRSVTLDQDRPIRSPISYPIFVAYGRSLRAAMDPEDVQRSRDEGRRMTDEDVYNCAMEVLA